MILSGDTTLVAAADDPHPALPTTLSLFIYPNPMNSEATFRFALPSYAGQVRFTVFNVLGQAVLSETLPALGPVLMYHFSPSTLASGVYIVRIEANHLLQTQKLVVLK